MFKKIMLKRQIAKQSYRCLILESMLAKTKAQPSATDETIRWAQRLKDAADLKLSILVDEYTRL